MGELERKRRPRPHFGGGGFLKIGLFRILMDEGGRGVRYLTISCGCRKSMLPKEDILTEIGSLLQMKGKFHEFMPWLLIQNGKMLNKTQPFFGQRFLYY